MIEFMLIGLPRSGTTWAANWLTTENTTCIHDPLDKYHYTEFDDIFSKKTLGISCTALYLYPEWVNSHPARKVIVHRPINEIKCSLIENDINIKMFRPYSLKDIKGVHINWKLMFDDPKEIYEYLLQKPFDKERHDVLKSINIQKDLSKNECDEKLMRRLLREANDRPSINGSSNNFN